MRILRGIGAVVVWLLATVVMVVALVASVTIVLLPLGVPLLVLGLRLYGYGVRLMIPRAPEVKRGVRKGLGLRAHGSLRGDAKRARRKTRRNLRKKTRGLKGRLAGGWT